MATLADLMERVASTVDQRATPPTVGSSEYNWRKVLVNRVVEELYMSYDFEWMRQSQYAAVTAAASVTLPINFKKMASFPVYYGASSEGEEWAEIKPHEQRLYGSSDHYFYILGNRGDRYTMVWNPGSLVSGASLFLDFYTWPSLITQSTDTLVVPSLDYMTNRTIAYIFEAKNDPRTNLYLSRSRESLAQIIEEENSPGRTYENLVPISRREAGFRFGRD